MNMVAVNSRFGVQMEAIWRLLWVWPERERKEKVNREDEGKRNKR
jgi:hypothetical protein